MLKYHNKLVVLLVMVTFLFSFTGSAAAALFTDVTGSSAEAGAIYKLNALGIVDGYPDGSFGASKTITRAEFAKIAVYTAGLQNVAAGMAASPSTFKDVKTTDWYNGWVNVAAARGAICVMASETLDQKVVTYLASDNYFAEGASTLLTAKFKDWGNLVEEKLVTNVDISGGKVKFTFTDMTKAPGAGDRSVTKTVASDAIYSNTGMWLGAAFRYVDYILNDDGEVAYIKVCDYSVVPSMDLDEVEAKSANEIKVDGKTYKVAANFGNDNSDLPGAAAFFLTQPAGTQYDTFLGNFNIKADGIELVLNEDGELSFIVLIAYPSVKLRDGLDLALNKIGVVDSTVAKSGKVVLEGDASFFTLDPDEPDDFFILRNGAPAAFADIKAGDFIYNANK